MAVVTWLIVVITLIVFVATMGAVVTNAVTGVTTQEQACEIIDLTNFVRTTIRKGVTREVTFRNIRGAFFESSCFDRGRDEGCCSRPCIYG